MKTAEAARESVDRAAAAYGRPASVLRGYAGVMAGYSALIAALSALLRARKALPERVAPGDFALAALATHKLSRTITKDAVTSPLRMPFTRFDGPAGPGEVNEQVEARGRWHSVGELVSCPFCLDQWIATGVVTGFLVAPRLTRYLTSIFAVRAGADLLHFGYAAAEQHAE